MQIKICGIRQVDQLDAFSTIDFDMAGFNFYSQSPRYIPESQPPEAFDILDARIARVGIFVQASEIEIRSRIDRYGLSYVQLHGGESPDFCRRMQSHAKVIKVFGVARQQDLTHAQAFDFCDAYLFDTKSASFGGSGQSFDWKLLSAYAGRVPYILSGGIGPDDLQRITKITDERLLGIDINSRFETAPGIKDIERLRTFCTNLRKQTSVPQ